MQDQSDSRTSYASRPTVRDELFGPPRATRRAQLSMVAFGLLLVVTLVIPVVSDTEAMPGFSLVALGMMMLMGFAELMDASNRRLAIAVRGSGLAVALLGFAIQMFRATGVRRCVDPSCGKANSAPYPSVRARKTPAVTHPWALSQMLIC